MSRITNNKKEDLLILTSENYYKWEFKMRNFLATKQLWKNCRFRNLEDYLRDLVIESMDAEESERAKIKLKEEGKDLKESVIVKKEDISLKERRNWKEDDDKAKSYIALSVSDKYVDVVNREGTAYAIWIELKAKCDSTLQMSMLQYNREYQFMKMND